METVEGRLAEVLAEPVAQAVRKLVAIAVDAHRVDPDLHRVLSEQIPRVGRLAQLADFDPANYTLFSEYLERHRDELRIADPDLAAFVCVTAIEALTHNAVLHRPKMLSRDAMDTLVDEAARLVTGYLKG